MAVAALLGTGCAGGASDDATDGQLLQLRLVGDADEQAVEGLLARLRADPHVRSAAYEPASGAREAGGGVPPGVRLVEARVTPMAAEALAARYVDDPLVSGFQYAGCWPLPAPRSSEGYEAAARMVVEEGCGPDPTEVAESGQAHGQSWEIIAWQHPIDGVCVGYRSISEDGHHCLGDEAPAPQHWRVGFIATGRGPIVFGPVGGDVATVELRSDGSPRTLAPADVGLGVGVAGAPLPDGSTSVDVLWLDADGRQLGRVTLPVEEAHEELPEGQPLEVVPPVGETDETPS